MQYSSKKLESAAEQVLLFRRLGLQPRRTALGTSGLSRLLRPPIFGGSP
jgi:hypothetical protein